MSVITSDGLSLLIGDGASTEVFTVLSGVTVATFDLTQEIAENKAIASDAWRRSTAVASRQVALSGDGLMTDEAAQQRLRSVSLNGQIANFQLKLASAETLVFSAYVSSYREVTQPGNVKRLSFQLESHGVVSVV